MTDQLRFAPIIRVSTEGQTDEEKHASLEAQTEEIQTFVEMLNGIIPESCWRYVGQEHATPHQERKKFDQLLSDAAGDLFDAVITTKADRFARDVEKASQAIDILKQHHIKFYIGLMEYNLFDGNQLYMLKHQALQAESWALQNKQRSLMSRYIRAKKNIPTAGKLPFGRTFDKQTHTWGLDPEKHQVIQQAAERYLSGESMVAIAKSYGMNHANLWKVLTKRAGPDWNITLNADDLNFHKEITLHIPALLDAETRQAIQNRKESNKTYTHGHQKHRYLLSSLVFCGHCGYSYEGQPPTREGAKRYYRHPYMDTRNGTCHHQRYIPATELENSVLLALVQTFGDQQRIQDAVERHTPDMQQITAMEQEREQLKQDMQAIQRQKNNIVKSIADDVISAMDAKAEMSKLKEQEQAAQERIENINLHLSNLPDPGHVKRISELGRKVFQNAAKQNPKIIWKRSYDWKKHLVTSALGGTDDDGNRYGVYLFDTEQGIEFEIRGMLEPTVLSLPISDEYLIDAFNLDPAYMTPEEIEQELQQIRLRIGTFTLYSPGTAPLARPRPGRPALPQA